MAFEKTNPEIAWQAYARTATTDNGERLNTYHAHYDEVREAFAAGLEVEADKLEAAAVEIARLEQELAAAKAQIPAPVVTSVSRADWDQPEVITLVTDRDRELAAAVLRAAAHEAIEIERIGATPYAALQPGDTQRFESSELADFVRSGDRHAPITWLTNAADRAAQGVLPAGAEIPELTAGD